MTLPFVGTWKLVSQHMLFPDGKRELARGENPDGILMYDTLLQFFDLFALWIFANATGGKNEHTATAQEKKPMIDHDLWKMQMGKRLLSSYD